METNNYTGLVPENTEGKSITAEANVVLASEPEAKVFYQRAKQRLLEVNNWGHLAGRLSADFQLTNAQGHNTSGFVQKGNYLRIDIAGPGSKAGKGYDWTQVEEVKEVHPAGVDSIAFLVRPAANPQTSSDTVAHFFSEKSTSTFVVTREGNKVTAFIHDRNIEANEETTEPLDKIRNAVVGLTAKHGFSKLQWQALAEAFISAGQE